MHFWPELACGVDIISIIGPSSRFNPITWLETGKWWLGREGDIRGRVGGKELALSLE